MLGKNETWWGKEVTFRHFASSRVLEQACGVTYRMESNNNKWSKLALVCVLCIGLVTLLALAIQTFIQ